MVPPSLLPIFTIVLRYPSSAPSESNSAASTSAPAAAAPALPDGVADSSSSSPREDAASGGVKGLKIDGIWVVVLRTRASREGKEGREGRGGRERGVANE